MDSEGVCAGEGGAGTWSDGKLTTKVGRNSDPVRRVLHILHAFGAPQVSLCPDYGHFAHPAFERVGQSKLPQVAQSLP